MKTGDHFLFPPILRGELNLLVVKTFAFVSAVAAVNSRQKQKLVGVREGEVSSI